MATLQESLAGAVRNGFCEGLPGVVTGALLFSALSATTVAGAGVGLGVAAGAAAIYGLGCNRPLPDDAYPAPPFSGGQCPILYNIAARAIYSGNAVPGGNVVNLQAFGAVQGIRFEPPVGNSSRVFILGGNPPGSTSGEQLAGSIPYSFSPQDVLVSLTIENVTPAFAGQPDNCGSLPPQPPGGITAPDATVGDDITYTNNDGIDVTVPIVIAYGYANVDVNGTLNIPVAVQVNLNPVVTFNGNLNLQTGDLNVNIGDPDSPLGGNGPCGGDPVTDPDTPEPTLPLPPSDPVPPSDPNKPEKRKILRGCHVITSVVQGRQTELDQGDNPDIYVPALGYVNFLVQVGSRTAWTADIPVKNTNQIIECPWIGGAIAARGTPSYNNQFQVYPIYTQQTFPRQFPPES